MDGTCMSKHYLNETKSAYPNVCYSRQGGLKCIRLTGWYITICTYLLKHTDEYTPGGKTGDGNIPK